MVCVKVVKIDVTGEFIGEKYLEQSPLNTDKVLFNVYNFKPWQALNFHLHPKNDEIFFIVSGRCIFYMENGAEAEARTLGENMAIYVPSGDRHAILSLDGDSVLLSVIGPQPVESVYSNGETYYCPACGLETPTIRSEGMTACPRCQAKLMLEKQGSLIVASVAGAEGQPGAQAQ